MLCKNCGQENAEGSLFCSSCGSRIVQENACPNCGNVYPEGSVFCNICGQKLDTNGCCPSCGKPVQENAVYCNHCGQRLDSRVHCLNCGEIFDGAFCPKCGTPVGESEVAHSGGKKKVDKTKLNEKLDKVFGKTGTSILLVGVIFALVFVFLIGFRIAIDFSEDPNLVDDILDGLNVSDKLKMNMYYYFGDAYKEIDELIQTSGIHKLPVEYTTPAMYFEAVLGTVIVAASILAVVVLSGLAIFTLVKKLRGKETKHAEKLSVAAMLSYVLGAISLYALNYVKAKIKVSNNERSVFAKVQLAMNSTTIAGIVLVSVALGLAFACYVLKNRSEYTKVKNVIPRGFGLISSVFAVIVTVFATSGIFNFISKLTDSYYHMTMTTSIQTTVYTNLLSWATYLQSNPDANINPYLALMVLVVLQFILMTLAIISLINQSASLMKNEKNNYWGVNVALAVVSIAYLALSIRSKNHTLDLTSPEYAGTNLLVPWIGEGSNKISVAPAIVSLVFALLTLATSVAERYIPTLFPKVEEKKEETVEEVNA